MQWFKCLSPKHPAMFMAEEAVGKHGAWECLKVVSEALHHDAATLSPELIKFWGRVKLDRAEVLLPYAQDMLEACRRASGSDRPPATVWKVLREQIFARDDYTCRYCGNRGVRLECDHVFPVSKGGLSEPDNLVTACYRCNRSKGAKTLSEWRRPYALV